MLLIVSVIGCELGSDAEVAGPEVDPVHLRSVGVWAFTVHGRLATCSSGWCPRFGRCVLFGSWHHPGDEYGMFGASVLISLWLVFLLDFSHPSEVYPLLITAGALPMAVLGFLLDRLPVSHRLLVLLSILWR